MGSNPLDFRTVGTTPCLNLWALEQVTMTPCWKNHDHQSLKENTSCPSPWGIVLSPEIFTTGPWNCLAGQLTPAPLPPSTTAAAAFAITPAIITGAAMVEDETQDRLPAPCGFPKAPRFPSKSYVTSASPIQPDQSPVEPLSWFYLALLMDNG